MICTYCNVNRVDNEAPCPNCGAPSPLLAASRANGWGTAGPVTAAWGDQAASSNAAWNQIPQLSFEAQPPSYGFQSPIQQPQGQQQSLLPVPYQNGMGMQPGHSLPLQLVPAQTIEQLLPALPEETESVYVPPMYTKPRAIIPRYRIISGVLSILIVSLIVCSGAGYYAQASGKLDQVKNFFTSKPPASLKAIPGANLPDPPDRIDKGPAYGVIPSASTASVIDPQRNITLRPEKAFKAGQMFYITYSVQHPNTGGTVYIKLYTDNAYFTTLQSKQIKAGDTLSGSATIVFPEPSEGKAELYWNNQLAQTLYFVVR
ncbi:MAG TPA: hypothetical protein VFU49_05110 [Ktedonobacteraceae bacterium]|nr:hypothetical protein [Ktedonobacteraceae bacterium]